MAPHAEAAPLPRRDVGEPAGVGSFGTASCPVCPEGEEEHLPDARTPADALVRGALLWLPDGMTVLVTRRHVDYVRVTSTGCPAVS